MTTATVCERDGYWAGALRRSLAARGAEVKLSECRSLEDCHQKRNEQPQTFFILETRTDGSWAEVCAFLFKASLSGASSRTAVVSSDPGFEPLGRALGAAHFASSTRELEPLVDLLTAHADSLPSPDQPLAAQMWSRLPWSESAERTSWPS